MTEKQACDRLIQFLVDGVKVFELKHEVHFLENDLCARAYKMERAGQLGQCMQFLRKVKAELNAWDDADDGDDSGQGTGGIVPR